MAREGRSWRANVDTRAHALIDTPTELAQWTGMAMAHLGADILGFVVEAVSGMSLDRFLAERVWAPLGMTETFFRPADSLLDRIAPTRGRRRRTG